jgi:hypothetical protein
MIETIITIAASLAAYRAVLAWANRGAIGSMRELFAVVLGGGGPGAVPKGGGGPGAVPK